MYKQQIKTDFCWTTNEGPRRRFNVAHHKFWQIISSFVITVRFW
jgi:hypothetical protein